MATNHCCLSGNTDGFVFAGAHEHTCLLTAADQLKAAGSYILIVVHQLICCQ